MIETSASDVRPVSDLKEELIGTPEALEYEDRLRQTGIHTDQPGSESLFSTASILYRGKYNMAGKSSLEALKV